MLACCLVPRLSLVPQTAVADPHCQLSSLEGCYIGAVQLLSRKRRSAARYQGPRPPGCYPLTDSPLACTDSVADAAVSYRSCAMAYRPKLEMSDVATMPSETGPPGGPMFFTHLRACGVSPHMLAKCAGTREDESAWVEVKRLIVTETQVGCGCQPDPDHRLYATTFSPKH